MNLLIFILFINAMRIKFGYINTKRLSLFIVLNDTFFFFFFFFFFYNKKNLKCFLIMFHMKYALQKHKSNHITITVSLGRPYPSCICSNFLYGIKSRRENDEQQCFLKIFAFRLAHWPSGQSVHQWSERPGFNPTYHTKDFKNGTCYLLD